MKTIILALLLAGFSGTGQAKDGESGMMFQGTLIAPPPCTINDGGQIDVDFGQNVGVNKVDGVRYRQKANYQIVCEKQGAGDQDDPLMLMLTLIGKAPDFDTQVLSTKQAGLGIRVYQDNKVFAPNTSINIELSHPPELEVVPVKDEKVKLTEGAFEALATLRAEYQ